MIKAKIEEIHLTNKGMELCLSKLEKGFFYQKGAIQLTEEEKYWLYHNNPTIKEGDIIEIDIKKA